MKSSFSKFFPFLAFGLLLVAAELAFSQQTAPSEATLAKQFEDKMGALTEHAFAGVAGSGSVLPGVSLAEGISEVTGVAISPLLGVSAVGAYQYWQSEPSVRARLPWYCQPWAWGTGLVILGLCFLKDVLGAALPGVLKKPLDWLELFEDKLSALVASTAFVPLVALAMSEAMRAQPEQAGLNGADMGLAMAPWLEWMQSGLQSPWVTVPLTLVLFGVVWLTSHTIHVLIALSPFSLVDSALKLSKLAVLALLTGLATMIHTVSPLPALLLCSIIALVSLLLARWSFRLLVFGTVMVSDLLFKKETRRSDLEEDGVWGFLARPVGRFPTRSRCRVEKDAATGQLFIVRRPWLVLPEQKCPLVGQEVLVAKGLLYPSLSTRADLESRSRRVMHLLPRYRRLEPSLAITLGGLEVRETALVRGFQAMRQWLSDLVSDPTEALAPAAVKVKD